MVHAWIHGMVRHDPSFSAPNVRNCVHLVDGSNFCIVCEF